MIDNVILDVQWSIGNDFNILQWRLVFNAMESCSMPLFIKLIFTQIRDWKSYWLPTSTVIPADIGTVIVEMFDLVEKKFGRMVVSHAVR